MARSLLLPILPLLVASVIPAAAHAEIAEPGYTCKVASPKSKLRAAFAPDTSLRDLASWVTGFTCKHVVFGSDVAKHATKLTVISSREMSRRQAIQLFVDAVESTGLVVTQKADTFIIKLGPKSPRGCPDLAGTPAVAPRTTAGELDAELDDSIRVVDATTRSIRRDLVDQMLANPMAIAKGARIVPSIKNGKPAGFKIYAIRPSSVYARLGLMNGDTVTALNGMELSSADKALEVYTSLRNAKRVVVSLERRGKPMTLVFTID